MPFCPECRDEFVAGVTRCPDCDRDLVDDLSLVPEAAPEAFEEPEDTTPAVVVARMRDELLARGLVSSLHQLAIPARVGREEGGLHPVEVPEDFGAAASAAVGGLGADDETPPLTEEDLARLDLAPGALRREGPAAVESLVRVFVRGRGEVAAQAALRLAGIGGEAVDVLRRALTEAVAGEEGGLARAAVGALRQYGHTAIPAELARLVGHDEPEVRGRAIRTIAALGVGGEAALPLVIRGLRDPDPAVREEAADAVWELTGGAVDLELEEEGAEARIRDLEERYLG